MSMTNKGAYWLEKNGTPRNCTNYTHLVDPNVDGINTQLAHWLTGFVEMEPVYKANAALP